VIEPEQLADALERLDPRERELLALSLRRRVPDDALARVYDVDSQEVARRRAGAIERLADELGAQRGEDLGAVLQALLDEGTWSAAEGVVPAAPAVVEEPEAPQPESTNGNPPVVPVASEPVLEMLAAREGLRGADGGAPVAESGRRRVPYFVILASFVAALIGGAAALVGSSEWGDNGGTTTLRQANDDGTRHFVPQLGGPLEAPFPSEPQSISCYSTARLTSSATLYKKPGGSPRIHVSKRTEWGSARVLGVVLRRGEWVAVQAPELDNGELAWLPTSRARLDCVAWSVHADLSRRMLFVRHDGRVVRKFQIAIGRAGNSTPKGRFTVTDKLRVTDPGSPYGCCVLALSGHQNHLPPGWPGGDRLAIHATKELSSIGKPASLGCMRITSVQARWLIRAIPAGSPVFVRA
jgi:hypothetical protein